MLASSGTLADGDSGQFNSNTGELNSKKVRLCAMATQTCTYTGFSNKRTGNVDTELRPKY